MLQQQQQQDQHPNLLEWLEMDTDQAEATTAQAQPSSGSSGTPEQQNPSSNDIEAQGEGSSLGRNSSETPTAGSQSTAGANSYMRQVAHQPIEAGPWADIEDAHTQASNTPSTAPQADTPHNRASDNKSTPKHDTTTTTT